MADCEATTTTGAAAAGGACALRLRLDAFNVQCLDGLTKKNRGEYWGAITLGTCQNVCCADKMEDCCEKSKSRKKAEKTAVGVIIGVVVAIIVVIIASIVACCYCCKRNKEAASRTEQDLEKPQEQPVVEAVAASEKV